MGWQAHFRATLFSAWSAAGLPAPERHAPAWREQLHELGGQYRGPTGRDTPKNPLDRAIVQAVQGFGALFGRLCIQLIGGPSVAEAARREAWCGEFNLGISLFDYLCDAAGSARLAAGLPSLLGLGIARAPAGAPNRDAAEPADYLDGLIRRVLLDLRQGGDRRHSAVLLRTLRSMFAAEMTLATPSRTLGGSLQDCKRIEQQLRLKSEEPFRVMAEWATRAEGSRHQTDRRRAARRLGRALGRCVWLIDDAMDLWEDLDAGQWNLFLLYVARIEPDLLGDQRNALSDARLASLLARHQVAERLSLSAARRVTAAVRDLDASPRVRDQALGVFAAALAAW
jgi:hypothetical protein